MSVTTTSACCNEGIFGGRLMGMVIGRLILLLFLSIFIGDTAIDGMGAMAGSQSLLVFLLVAGCSTVENVHLQ